MTPYKTMDGTAGAYGHGEWSLPKGGRPGKWMPKQKPRLCYSGYHYCERPLDCLNHYGPELYEIEVRGEVVVGDDKSCAAEARLLRRVPEWNDETLRLFAADCARVSVNRYAQEGQRELFHACLDVAAARALYGQEWDAAGAAAWDAAGDAARDAAGAAARAAAWAAAGDAAGAAAGAAAGDAAWAAAWAAAGAAAGAAAWDAARAAAWAAAWDEQNELLTRYLSGEQGPLVEAEP